MLNSLLTSILLTQYLGYGIIILVCLVILYIVNNRNKDLSCKSLKKKCEKISNKLDKIYNKIKTKKDNRLARNRVVDIIFHLDNIILLINEKVSNSNSILFVAFEKQLFTAKQSLDATKHTIIGGKLSSLVNLELAMSKMKGATKLLAYGIKREEKEENIPNIDI